MDFTQTQNELRTSKRKIKMEVVVIQPYLKTFYTLGYPQRIDHRSSSLHECGITYRQKHASLHRGTFHKYCILHIIIVSTKNVLSKKPRKHNNLIIYLNIIYLIIYYRYWPILLAIKTTER